MNRLSFMQRCCALLSILFLPVSKLELMDGRCRLEALKLDLVSFNIHDGYYWVDLESMDNVSVTLTTPHGETLEISDPAVSEHSILLDNNFHSPGEWKFQAQFKNNKGIFQSSIVEFIVK